MSRMAEETPLPGQFQTHWLAQRWRAVACVTWCVSPNIAKLKLITNAPHMKRPGEHWSPELRTFWKLSGWLNPSQGWVRVDFGYHAKLEIWGEPLIWMFKRELPKNARCSPRICHIHCWAKEISAGSLLLYEVLWSSYYEPYGRSEGRCCPLLDQ